MSLEQTLTQTNELLKQVITILQSGISAPADLGQPEVAVTKRSPGRPKKETSTEAVAGTVYWSIPSMNSVFAQEPSMAAPTMPDAVKVTKEEYEAKKAEISARVDEVIAAQRQATITSAKPATHHASTQPTAGAAAGDAPTNTAASAGTSAQSAATAQPALTAATETVKYADVLAKFKLLNVGTEPGQGRDGVMAVLKKFLPNEAAPTVSKIEALGRNADVMAELDSLLKPAAAAPADDFDPLA